MSDQDNFTSSKPSTSSEPVPSTPKSISNLTRIQRNVAEKQRRDKLNGYISELATIVPMVSMSSKRLDKTSILRLSAAHLRLSKSPLSGTKKLKKSFKWCPSFLTGDQVRDILESVDGFLIVTSSSGKILFTSSSVERYLGHQNIDLIGHSLFMFIHPDDVDSVKEEMEGLLSASLKSGDSDPAPRCSFRCRMKEKGQPRSEVATYQYVHFTGNMTVFDDEEGNSKNPKSTAIVTHLFKAFVRIVDANPYCQLSLEEATADEYITRHTLDGTIIFADHRLATITGHLPQEVTGLSAYKYILPDDVSIALFAHHLMFSNDKGTGMVVYRLRTRDEKYVYLKSVGSLQFDRATSQVDHFVCVNQHLSDEEGEAQLKYFTDRFIPHIQDSSALTLMESVKAFQVVGLNPPHNIGGVKDILSLNKFSLFNNSNLGTQNHADNTNAVKNKVSNCILENLSIHPQSQNYASSSSESSLSPVIASQISSPLKPLPDKSSKTVVSVSSVSSDFQTKTKKDVLSINRKRRASDSIPAKSSFPNVKTVDSIVTVPESTERTLLSTKPVIMQNGDIITSLDIPSSNGFHVSSVPLQNLSVKEEIFCATNEIKQVAFRNENKHLPYVNQASDYDADYQSLLKHASCQTIDNSGFEQMHISEVSAAKNVNDIHLQISSESDICSALIQSPFNKKYGEKVCTETSMSNTANTYDMPSENVLDVKSNIMLSTSSVLYSNDLQKKVSKAAVVNSNKLKSSSNTFSIRKTRLSDSDQLSSNVNDVVIETNLWPVETNSESSASNTAGEDTFVSATACSGDDPNLYFLPAEEMKDYLGDTDDITSVLNTALPFDDSSLPSVDGWNQYLRPEDMLNHPNVNTVVHIDGEQHLINGINGYEEKPSEMW